MGADQLRWYQFGMKLRRQNGDCSTDLTDQCQRVDHPQASIPTPSAHRRTAADCDGAMVARSQIVVSGSTAMLLGTMTNETGFDVCFSGMPPYAVTFDTDGSEPILLGDFNSPPREQPSSGDWVIHPGASVPYRSLPVTLQTPDPQWDGAHWCTSSQYTTLDIAYRSQREVSAIQVIN